jgi:hypothetical protein
MEIRVVDKAGKTVPSAREALEALGLGELWKAVYDVPRGEVARAIAAILRFCDLYPVEEGCWRGRLDYNVTVHLKRDKGDWIVEVAVPFEYDEGTALLLRRMEHLAEDVERVKHAIETLNGRIKELEMLLRKRGEEEGMDEEAAERLAEVLEKLSKILGERER